MSYSVVAIGGVHGCDSGVEAQLAGYVVEENLG